MKLTWIFGIVLAAACSARQPTLEPSDEMFQLLVVPEEPLGTCESGPFRGDTAGTAISQTISVAFNSDGSVRSGMEHHHERKADLRPTATDRELTADQYAAVIRATRELRRRCAAMGTVAGHTSCSLIRVRPQPPRPPRPLRWLALDWRRAAGSAGRHVDGTATTTAIERRGRRGRRATGSTQPHCLLRTRQTPRALLAATRRNTLRARWVSPVQDSDDVTRRRFDGYT